MRASKYVRQNLIKMQRDIHKSILIVGDFNNSLYYWKMKQAENH